MLRTYGITPQRLQAQLAADVKPELKLEVKEEVLDDWLHMDYDNSNPESENEETESQRVGSDPPLEEVRRQVAFKEEDEILGPEIPCDGSLLSLATPEVSEPPALPFGTERVTVSPVYSVNFKPQSK